MSPASLSGSASQSQQTRQSQADQASDPMLEKGIALARKGDFKQAEEAFQQAVTNQPNDPRALTALGQVQEQLGKTPDSIETFSKVIALDPRSSDAHVNLGIALGDHADLAAALQESLVATRLAPDSASAHFLRGRLLSDLGRRDEARAEFRKVLTIAPGYAEALNYWAALEGDEGNMAAQESLLTRYVKLRPENATAWVQLGQVLNEQHRQPEAVAAWRHALAINPRYMLALYSLVRALKSTDPAECRQLVQRIQELERDKLTIDQIKMLGNKSNAEMDHTDYRAAVDDLREAKVLCGNCELLGNIEKNLGLAYCHAGQLDAGERELKLAKALKPADSDLDQALAVVKLQRDQAQANSR
jgi:tetratricopeptide (TPR) repeat protein